MILRDVFYVCRGLWQEVRIAYHVFRLRTAAKRAGYPLDDISITQTMELVVRFKKQAEEQNWSEGHYLWQIRKAATK